MQKGRCNNATAFDIKIILQPLPILQYILQE